MLGREPLRCLIDGELVAGKLANVINPATAEPFASFHAGDARLVGAAVKAASSAFSRWREAPLVDRRALLLRLADVIRDNTEQLARLLTLEQGKPQQEARDEVAATEALFLHYATVHASQHDALFTTEDSSHLRFYTPLGVVAGIVPWNFPLLIAAMKIAPALLTGNAIIIKPAPTTPLTTLEFARLCSTVVPPGLMQVIGDDGSLGPLLIAHPGIRKISFTGSTLTGRKIMESASSTLKRLNLELGGNDPAIVLGDAAPAAAAAGIFRAAFRNGGQVCGAVKRVYVHQDIYIPFVRSLADHIAKIMAGDGFQPGVTLGPLQNHVQYEKARDLLSDATKTGRILAQSGCPRGRGYFIPATLVGELDDQHPLVSEEQFAPLLPIQRFVREDEVITRANSTPYGLTASVWSSDEKRGEAVVKQLDAALLCVNKHNKCSFQYGLHMCKASGTGWIFGDEGIKEFLQPRLLSR